MALSKSQRIMVLLGIDGVFFLIELIVGYTTHSLALIADSFHMLNDVLSLCVGLWAVKVAHQKPSSNMYTYGWQRAETLGALVNGVFLVALCLSIFLEAIQRFFEPQEVGNPQLVLLVGCLGLASNILGLLLFHDHSHGHGGGHTHEHNLEGADAIVEHSEDVSIAEHGQSIYPQQSTQYGTETVSNGNYSAVNSTAAASKSSPDQGRSPQTSIGRIASGPDSSDATISEQNGLPAPLSPSRRHRRRTSVSRSRHTSVEEIHIHPASFRHDIIAASRMESIESAPATDSEAELSSDEAHTGFQESSSLLPARTVSLGKEITDSQHATHKHRKPKISGDKKGGHSHGDLNMRGVFLHVLGDALGNFGVIASALFIWLTDFSWRFYSDPVISLVITVIILCSALPLCRAASRILLQGVPAGISVDDIKEDIEDLPGVVSCHHLHVWQLSDTKLIASLHIQVALDYRGTDAKQYMRLARAVRTCLHEYGIHSSTIQPEFCLDARHQHAPQLSSSDGTMAAIPGNQASRQESKANSRAASLLSLPDACLLDCGENCGKGRSCCSDPSPKGNGSGGGP